MAREEVIPKFTVKSAPLVTCVDDVGCDHPEIKRGRRYKIIGFDMDGMVYLKPELSANIEIGGFHMIRFKQEP